MKPEWIESHLSLKNHPKTKRLAKALNVNIFEALGIIHSFWYWALEYVPDGDLSGLEDWEVVDGIGYETDNPEDFIDALFYAGFVDKSDEGELSVHEHNSINHERSEK